MTDRKSYRKSRKHGGRERDVKNMGNVKNVSVSSDQAK